VLKIFRHGHLGRINIGPFVAAIEEPIEFGLCFTLGSVKRDEAGRSFAAERITPDVKL
jgi:hypothetical protein